MGEHFRVFPISNWTEMDVWNYILHENISIPSLYFYFLPCSLRLSIVLLPVALFQISPHLSHSLEPKRKHSFPA
jgi:sulfate adenylyltransferase subunit 2